MSDLSEFKLLELAPHDGTSRLHAVLGAGLKKVTGKSRLDPVLPHWRPSFFELEKSSIYKQLNEPAQDAVLKRCSLNVLHEAFFIEESGMAYASKMALMAETREERMLYNLFAADEATHFHWVQSAMGHYAEDVVPNQFHRLLEGIIREGHRESLVFIIQVILEGWGLSHYRSLHRHCQQLEFRDILERILRDEARHHGSGVVLCRERGLPDVARQQVVETMRAFLDMVRAGPQGVLEAISQECGGLSKADRLKTLKELGAEDHSLIRLKHLQELMLQEGFEPIVEELEACDSFVPYAPELCV